MNINIKLETIFKFLASAVLPLGLWLINLNSQVSELSSTVRRLESTHTPKISELASKQTRLISEIEQISTQAAASNTRIDSVEAQAQDNSATIREIRVSLRYIEEGVRAIKTRIIGPNSPQ